MSILRICISNQISGNGEINVKEQRITLWVGSAVEHTSEGVILPQKQRNWGIYSPSHTSHCFKRPLSNSINLFLGMFTCPHAGTAGICSQEKPLRKWVTGTGTWKSGWHVLKCKGNMSQVLRAFATMAIYSITWKINHQEITQNYNCEKYYKTLKTASYYFK